MPVRPLTLLLPILLMIGFVGLRASQQRLHAAEPGTYEREVLADQPTAWWRFSETDGQAGIAVHPKAKAADDIHAGRIVGKVKLNQAGPRNDQFLLFDGQNAGAEFFGDGGHIAITDPGDNSPLDFRAGETITLEAWIKVTKLARGQQMYVVGKGRTKNPGVAAENQNYALRISNTNDQQCLSFLFRDERNRAGEQNDFHRWNSKTGPPVNSGWHHIAVSYTFGEPGSIRGWIDGQPQEGDWDYGGATTLGPVVDNDELWIGSSLGGNPSNSFVGVIDEVALYRGVLSNERIQIHAQSKPPVPNYITPRDAIPEQTVLLEVFEGFLDNFSWKFSIPTPSESFRQEAFSLTELPLKYNAHGVRADRSNPLMVRLSGWVTFPAGSRRLLLRSLSGSRMSIDGKPVGEVPFPKNQPDGHGPLHILESKISSQIRPPQPGHRESAITFEATGQPQLISVEVYAGGKKKRPEFGEFSLCVEHETGEFRVLTFGEPASLTDAGWLAHVAKRNRELDALNRQRREVASTAYRELWKSRHAKAKTLAESWPALDEPVAPADARFVEFNRIDRFINAKLAASEPGVLPMPITDDWQFLRRVTLDLAGTIPTPGQIERYFADAAETRRAKLVDRLLFDPAENSGWADHWVSYWQDVLAENPNILNPTLNNTGPFRWWVHESFVDNKPFDRFATELILMEGSQRYGGTAGFAVATQNDSPMAAKAHILAQAFLGMEMKCARCHDAPYHHFTQKDLFSLAAMLKREPEKIPKTSTIPVSATASAAPNSENAVKSLLVRVTLKPGEAIPPDWPFAKEFAGSLSPDILERPDDHRERLAALVTSAENHRFAQVAVNRVWQRLMGRGLIDPIDDWEHPEPSHPVLLEYLEREFVRNGFDLKQLTKLIVSSHAYQRQTDAEAVKSARAALFAGPSPRKLSAEQIVDSLFLAAGKSFHVEELNIDVDAQRPEEQSITLGNPSRSWMMTSLSNERDRPSLSLPAAQTVLNVLEAFGWRSARQDPVSVRPNETTVLQPAVLANGVLGKRIAQLSDDSRFTQLALKDQPVESLVDQFVRTIHTRSATDQEKKLFTDLLRDGYEVRKRTPTEPAKRPGPPAPTGVSWSNHLHPHASELKLAVQEQVQQGDPPTNRLTDEWRERAEDVIWTLINSPEFIMRP